MPNLSYIRHDDILIRAVVPIVGYRIARDKNDEPVRDPAGTFVIESYNTFDVIGPYKDVGSLKRALRKRELDFDSPEVTLEQADWRPIDE